MIHEHRFEVMVAIDTDTGQVRDMFISEDENSDDKLWDGKQWVPLNEESEWWPNDQTATAALGHALRLPWQIIGTYRAWTGPNGYDINIMSDIAGLLVEGGWVDEDDVIIDGEWPDGDGLVGGVPSSMVIMEDSDGG